MEWIDVPAGTINAAQQRLWVALGDSADIVAYNIINNQGYLDLVARILLRGTAPQALAEPPKPSLTFLKKTALGSTSVTAYGLGQRLTIAQMLRARLEVTPHTPTK